MRGIASASVSPAPSRSRSSRDGSIPPRSRRSDTIQRATSYPVRARSGSDSPASASTPASVETAGDPEHRVRGRALEDLGQPLVEPPGRPAAGELVDGRVGVLVDDHPLDFSGRRTNRADQEPDLPVEQSGGPRVGAGHAPELRVLVQHDRRPLLRDVREHQPDALGGGLEVGDDRATGFGVAALADTSRRSAV